MPSFIRATGPDGWLTAARDGARLAWAALYWNSQKTLFRLRGARGRAPCQHPSDSGRAGESHCEACIGLADPRRFARICPLIRFDHSPRGPRCSVAAAAVRPFWGRVLAALGLGGLGGALLLAAAALLAFHAIGYEVKPGDVLWPPRWGRVRTARADYFRRRGLAAYARGDAQGSFLALLEAHRIRPGDFATDRLLAQLALSASPDFADTLLAQLVRSPDPAQAANAAQAWGALLLAQCNFTALGGLSAEMLRRGPSDSSPAWTNALIFSARLQGDSAVVRRLLAEPGRLPADCRSALEWSLRPADAQLSAELLAAGRNSPSLYVRHYALGRLIRDGHARDVLDVLASPAGLPAREVEELRLSAWGQLNWTEPRRREIARLVADPALATTLAELLAAQLIIYPDRAAGDAVLEAFTRRLPPPSSRNYGAYAAYTCLAGVDQDVPRLTRLTAALEKISGRPAGAESAVAGIFMDRSSDRAIPPLLLALQPLPLEIMFALLSDYPRLPRAPAQEPKP